MVKQDRTGCISVTTQEDLEQKQIRISILQWCKAPRGNSLDDLLTSTPNKD
jgi:hypothetical protein